MIRRPPRSTRVRSSAASDVYKRQVETPSAEQWRLHWTGGHVPYRPWCPACVAGRGRTEYHRQLAIDRRDEKPTVVMDYAFFSKKGEIRTEDAEGKAAVKVVVVKDRKAKAVSHLTVPSKGANNPYNVAKVRASLEEWGRTDITLKSVQEPARVDLKKAVREQRAHETVEEQSRREGRQENG